MSNLGKETTFEQDKTNIVTYITYRSHYRLAVLTTDVKSIFSKQNSEMV